MNMILEDLARDRPPIFFCSGLTTQGALQHGLISMPNSLGLPGDLKAGSNPELMPLLVSTDSCILFFHKYSYHCALFTMLEEEVVFTKWKCCKERRTSCSRHYFPPIGKETEAQRRVKDFFQEHQNQEYDSSSLVQCQEFISFFSKYNSMLSGILYSRRDESEVV